MIKRLLAIVILLAAPAAVFADDRHEGYYYPGPVTEEVYGSRAEMMPEADRGVRLSFITGFTQEQFGRAYTPPYALFAKGTDSEKLLLIATGPGGFRTIHQARAVLAQLTAISRGTPLFRDLKVEEIFTFLDLVKMMGFTQVTVSDGSNFAHRIVIE